MMGWAHGQNNNGREIGYAVEATCDFPGCEAKIDRGLAHCCGGLDGVGNGGMDDTPYCGDYFCGKHLLYGIHDPDDILNGPVCPTCMERSVCQACEGKGHDADGEICSACDSFGNVVSREAVGQ